MKKILLLLTCVLSWSLAFAETADRKIKFKELPRTAQLFVQKAFPAQRVLEVEMDEDDHTYEVKLSGDIEIDFDREGRWTEIESEKKGIPHSALSERVYHKVKSAYPGQVRMVKVKRNSKETVVELSDGRKVKVDRVANLKSKHDYKDYKGKLKSKSKDKDDDDDDDDDED